jgi:hypothetical protein
LGIAIRRQGAGLAYGQSGVAIEQRLEPCSQSGVFLWYFSTVDAHSVCLWMFHNIQHQGPPNKRYVRLSGSLRPGGRPLKSKFRFSSQAAGALALPFY